MSVTPHRSRMSRAAAVRAGSLIAACGAAGLLATAATAVHASAAEAAGSMEVAPATGTDTSGITLTTPTACPASATNLIVAVRGSGFPAGGQIVVSNSPIGTYTPAPNGGVVVPLTQTMRDYASTAGFTTLQGRYDFTLTCRTAFNGTSLGDFTAPIWFTSNTAYRNTDPAGATGTPTTTPATTAPTSATAAPTDTVSPTDTAAPTDSASATDTAQPTGTAAPTDTSAADGGSSGGGSQDVSTDVNGGSSGAGPGRGSLAATGVAAGALGALSGALVLAGVVIVRRARPREDFPATDTPNT